MVGQTRFHMKNKKKDNNDFLKQNTPQVGNKAYMLIEGEMTMGIYF